MGPDISFWKQIAIYIVSWLGLAVVAGVTWVFFMRGANKLDGEE